jgi:putative membrane-bound dehydrogenase-like protein
MILQGMQQAMGPLPDRSQLADPDIAVSETTTGKGYQRKTITFVAEPGDRVSADLYIPDGASADDRRPAMLALHPTGAQGKRIVAGEGPRLNRQYAVELAERGYVVIAPDYPSFGDLKDYDFNSDSYVSGTMKGIFNHMRCVDLLQAMDYVDGDRIGVIGHSLGGHNAMFVGVFDQRLKVVVSSCGWTPFHDYYAGNITGWTSDRYMPRLRDEYGLDPSRVPFDFYEVVAALAPRAFFSSSPVEDANFDVNGVRKAIPAAADVYGLFDAQNQLQVRYPECDHDFPTETRAEAYRFIDSVLDFKPTGEIDYSAELPRIAAREPAEAMKSFDMIEGFQIQQTATEPLVTDPVAMSFDADSRLYVAEMKDYSEQENDFLGQVRVLEDTDGDGVFDSSHILAEGLSWPTAILCYDGGVFVGAPPEIMYLKDTTGDGQADLRKTVFTGFGRGNVQGLLNCLRWGLDNRVHGAASSAGGLVRRPDQPESEAINLRGHDFSFDPRKLDLRAESGGAQHGMSFDDWGRKFVCSNSDHAQMVVYDERYTARNPSLRAPGARVRIAVDGGQAPVFRTSQVEPWRIVRTRLRVSGQVGGPVEGGGRPAGYFTGATGITIYRGDAWPEALLGTAFIADVGSNIVHRKQLTANGVVFKASRVDEGREFLASEDVWFRPVQFANAPDGCLHILDMYRETIEHPKSLPPEIKQHLDLTSGRDRGRLYRVVPDGFQAGPLPKLSGLSTADLVDLLNHRNGWHRDTASRLLYERNDHSAVEPLTKLAASGARPETRLHALYALDGLGSLQAETVLAALSDQNPRVREHAVRFAEAFADNSQIQAGLLQLTTDPDARVRFQLAFTVGQFADDWKVGPLVQLMTRDGQDSWIRMAALSSVSGRASQVLAELIRQDSFLAQEHAGTVIAALAAQIDPRRDSQQVQTLAQQLVELSASSPDQATTALREFLIHAPRLTAALRADAVLNNQFDTMIAAAGETVTADAAATADRLQAISILVAARADRTAELLMSLLGSQQPAAIQQAAIVALKNYTDTSIAETIIEQWATLTPALRRDAEELLFSRDAWIVTTLKAVEDGTLRANEIGSTRWTVLASHKNADIRETAVRLKNLVQTSSRAEQIQKYRPALQLAGDVDRGRTLFRKTCATCHRLENHGHELGPNLATIRNRGREAILLNVLDPNREVNPQFTNYIALTNEGLTHTGMITEESSTVVTLTRAENKKSTLLRQDLDELRSSGLSLMPEGIEKDLDLQAMADVLSYLMQVQ